jgi:hypothetical protein
MRKLTGPGSLAAAREPPHPETPIARATTVPTPTLEIGVRNRVLVDIDLGDYFLAPLRASSSTKTGQKPLGLALKDPVFTILIFMCLLLVKVSDAAAATSCARHKSGMRPAYFLAPLRASSSTKTGQKPLGLALKDPVFTILIFIGISLSRGLSR